MEQSSHKWRTALLAGALALMTLSAFWPVAHHGFIGYDDEDYVTSNPQVQAGLSWGNVRWAFATGRAGNWHPLTWLSHMLDVSLFGLDSGRHHLVSLLLHTASTLLLFVMLRRATGALWRSAGVAALFAVHPLHVESVAWAAERKDVLSGLFFMLTLWAYVRYGMAGSSEVRRSSLFRWSSPWQWYWLALLFFALGLLCKPMLVTMPGVLILLDFWPLRRLRLSGGAPGASYARILAEKLPFVGLAVVLSIVTLTVQTGAMSSPEHLPLSGRLANAVASYLKYLGQTVWPTGLTVFYPHPSNKHSGLSLWPAWQLLAAAAVLMLVSWLAWLRRASQPWFLTGWFWYLGTLVPVIGLVQVGGQAMADRYTYIPLIGVFVCAAWGTAQAAARWRWGRFAAAMAGTLAVGACFAATRQQVAYWKDDFTLFEHALSVNERNAPAHTGLAAAFGRQRKFAFARVHAQAAVQADPSYSAAWRALGDAFDALGKPQQAVQSYETSLRLNPDQPSGWFQLAYANSQLGKPDDAIRHYRSALRLQPDFVSAHNNLASVLWGLGRRDEALEEFAAAVRLSPAAPDKRYNLGSALVEAGRLQEAVPELTEALRLRPDYAPAHRDLGLALAQQGKLAEAAGHLEDALRLAPGPDAHYNLGLVLGMQGKCREAIAHYEESLKAKPDWPPALNDLAWILATAPQTELRNGPEAVRMAERAVELTQGRNPNFLGSLDAAYAEAGRFAEAISTAERARDRALSLGAKAVAASAEKRIALYRNGQAYRQGE